MKKLLAGHISTGAVVAGLTIALQSMALAAGPSPLAATVKRGDVAAARAILRRGPAAAKVADADGTTPLHLATDQNDAAMWSPCAWFPRMILMSDILKPRSATDFARTLAFFSYVVSIRMCP